MCFMCTASHPHLPTCTHPLTFLLSLSLSLSLSISRLPLGLCTSFEMDMRCWIGWVSSLTKKTEGAGDRREGGRAEGFRALVMGNGECWNQGWQGVEAGGANLQHLGQPDGSPPLSAVLSSLPPSLPPSLPLSLSLFGPVSCCLHA